MIKKNPKNKIPTFNIIRKEMLKFRGIYPKSGRIYICKSDQFDRAQTLGFQSAEWEFPAYSIALM